MLSDGFGDFGCLVLMALMVLKISFALRIFLFVAYFSIGYADYPGFADFNPVLVLVVFFVTLKLRELPGSLFACLS